MLGFQEGVGASQHFTFCNYYNVYKINGNIYISIVKTLRISQKTHEHTGLSSQIKSFSFHPLIIFVLHSNDCRIVLKLRQLNLAHS